MLNQLKIKRDTYVKRVKALADTDAQLSESESKEVDELRSKITTLDEDIARKEYAEQLELNSVRAKSDNKFETAKQQFNIAKVIRRLAGIGNDDVGFEREVSEELRKRSGHAYEGTPVPFSALAQRTQTAGTATAGGNLVSTDLLANNFIDFLRPMLAIGQLGATVLDSLMGKVDIPRQTSGYATTWLGETGAVNESNIAFDKITLSPKKAMIMGSFSKFMMLQSSPAIQMLIQQDMSRAVAQALDTVALQGGGNNEPVGIIGKYNSADAQYKDGLGTTKTAAAAADTALTYKAVLALMQALNEANVGMTSRAFLTNYKVANALKTVSRNVATTDMNAVFMNGMIADERTVVSNIAPSGLSAGTKGSETTVSNSLIAGNWSDLIIGVWESLDLLVNPYESSAYKAGNVLVLASMVCDVQARHKESFAYLTNVKAS